MRLGGIEPSSQEPESYVRSITLQAQTVCVKQVPYYTSEKWFETQGIFTCFQIGRESDSIAVSYLLFYLHHHWL